MLKESEKVIGKLVQVDDRYFIDVYEKPILETKQIIGRMIINDVALVIDCVVDRNVKFSDIYFYKVIHKGIVGWVDGLFFSLVDEK